MGSFELTGRFLTVAPSRKLFRALRLQPVFRTTQILVCRIVGVSVPNMISTLSSALRPSLICALVFGSVGLLTGATPNPTTTQLGVQSTTGLAGSVFTFTATVTVNGKPVTAGSVLFKQGTRLLGKAQVVVSGPSAGTAILKTTSFGPGLYDVTASYSGAPQSAQSTASSTSAPVVITVTGIALSSTSLSVFPSATQQGTYDLIATVFARGSTIGHGTLGVSAFVPNFQVGLGSAEVTTTGGYLAPQNSFQDTLFTAVAVGDFNGDGIPDLAFVTDTLGPELQIELGDPNHPGLFLSPTAYPLSSFADWIAVGDVNSDGLPDVIVGAYEDDIGLFLNDRNTPGQLKPEQVLGSLLGFGGNGVLADLNGDGLLDLAVPAGQDVMVFFGEPANPGQFLAPQGLNLGIGAGVGNLVIADFNQDGLPDLAVSSPSFVSDQPALTAISIYLADAAHPGHFASSATYPSPGSGTELLGDFNGDGLPDILAGSVLLLNDPTHPGHFRSVATSPINSDSYQNAFVVDINGDGISDVVGLTPPLFSCPRCDTNPAYATILLSDPAHPGQWSLPGTNYSVGVNNYGGLLASAVADFNGDGQPDLVVASPNGMAVTLGSQIASLKLFNAVVPGGGISTVGAAYTGDNYYVPSVSGAVVIQTSALLTTTQLTSSSSQTAAGSQVTLTASVEAAQGTPSGSVAFYDGASVLCTVSLSAFGQAICATPFAGIGPHSLSAAYSPTGPYASSTSGSLALLVTGAVGTNSLTASPNPIVVPVATLSGTTAIQWNAAAAQTVEIHIGSPTGILFVAGGGSGSAETGPWVTDGMQFYLQDTSGGKPLTADNTLALLVVPVQQQPFIWATPNPIPVPPGSVLGMTTIQWNVPSVGEWFTTTQVAVEVHVNSPTGPLFASGGNSGSATTGEWVTDGMTFYLQDVTGNKALTTSGTIGTLVVHLQQQLAVFTAGPNPIPAGLIGATTLSWNAPTATRVQIHVGSPTGTLFAGGPSVGSAVTGEWVTDGMVFFLQDVSGGKPLTPANTLAQLVVHVGLSAYFSASPNPILTWSASGASFLEGAADRGSTTLQWRAPSASTVEIHEGGASGPLVGSGGPAGSVPNVVVSTDGTAFYLQDATNGDTTSPSNTLGMLVVHLQQPSAPFLIANPNPAQGLGLGVATTTLQWNAPAGSTVQIRVGNPAGTLFAEGGSTGTATTGNWVTNGMLFYLQDVTGGKPLTAADTLAVLIVLLSN
jgi:Bacterial Ig-like domain (group 3)/FG-GAP-like repeat/FG-GAP repeat